MNIVLNHNIMVNVSLKKCMFMINRALAITRLRRITKNQR